DARSRDPAPDFRTGQPCPRHPCLAVAARRSGFAPANLANTTGRRRLFARYAPPGPCHASRLDRCAMTTANTALRLAVVGHTNTGKTSLLRTLTHDAGFGKVSDAPGTTRHVEGARLLLNGAAAVELYDTPGLEDGIGLLDYLD